MPAPATDPQTLAEQLLLGRYRVLETRGQGGFGTVYVCWDPRLMRRVAIKSIELRPQAPSGSLAEGAPDYLTDARKNALLKAALNETRTASMLPHPNIVQMIDFESDETHAYIIMEYVEGASLAELLDATEDSLLTCDEAAAVVEGVCDALAFAHDNGVLHLDIKPDNIMIDMSGRVKLADFGMATLSSMTGYSGARGGTPGYMPPEQAEGGEVDVRTDVFAFAAVMYEALCGFRPFAADSASQSRELVLAGAPDPCAVNDSVDPRAADALLDALESDPDARTASAADFAAQILPGLGRPRQGRRSLAELVRDVLDDSRQTEGEEQEGSPGAASPHASYDPDGGIVSQARPRAASIVLRLAGALAPAVLVTMALWAVTGEAGTQACVAAFFIVAALGLVAPQIASFAAPVAVGVACIAHGTVAMGAALVAATLAWWAFIGRLYPLQAAGTFLSCLSPAMPLPLAPLACGYLLPPGPAAASTALGCLTQAGLLLLGGGAPGVVFALMSAGWSGAAAAQAALGHTGSKTRCYLASLLALVIILAVQLGCNRMENEGVWTSMPQGELACALGSTILVALLIFAFGSSARLEEGLSGTGAPATNA